MLFTLAIAFIALPFSTTKKLWTMQGSHQLSFDCICQYEDPFRNLLTNDSLSFSHRHICFLSHLAAEALAFQDHITDPFNDQLPRILDGIRNGADRFDTTLENACHVSIYIKIQVVCCSAGSQDL